MPYRPSADAAFRVNVIRPPFETEYGPSFGSPMYALTDPMFTIDPPPRVFIDFTASCRHRNGARRLTARTMSQTSSDTSSRYQLVRGPASYTLTKLVPVCSL